MTTNITAAHLRMWHELTSGHSNFAIASTTFNGDPTAAIVVINREDDGEYLMTPIAAFVTKGMFGRLTESAR